jgi:hypothetical protein
VIGLRGKLIIMISVVKQPCLRGLGRGSFRDAPGSETGPGPQLVTWGKSTILSVDAHGFKFEYTLNSAKHIPFDWGGP